jgi:hypothetical protein
VHLKPRVIRAPGLRSSDRVSFADVLHRDLMAGGNQNRGRGRGQPPRPPPPVIPQNPLPLGQFPLLAMQQVASGQRPPPIKNRYQTTKFQGLPQQFGQNQR